MNFNPETMTLTLDLLATTGFGCIMVFLGRAIVRRVRPFQEWGLPAPVIGGLLVALILSLLKANGIFAVTWTTALSSHLMNIFFTCVGFGFSKTLLERGKKFCAGIALSVLLLVLLQGFLGIAVAIAVGMHPLLTLMAMYVGYKTLSIGGMILGPIILMGAEHAILPDSLTGGLTFKTKESVREIST